MSKKIEGDGWYQISQEGSHRHYKHPTRKGKVTVAGHLSDEVRVGTLLSIERSSGVKLR
ncbi:MAG TPA: type II toxin-antitoxin system HicA family toxin [Chloroflexia bacterium]|nr:type II toxin-antitoxin system HicA family toxin [Chloroflexia bacterium]